MRRREELSEAEIFHVQAQRRQIRHVDLQVDTRCARRTLWTTKTFFSEILQQNGYQTAVVGKWHMRCEPKGFDYYQVLWDQGAYYHPEFKSKDTNGKYVRREGYATTLTTDYAIDFLEHRNTSMPFCLLVHHKAPHRNWMPEPKYLHLYENAEFLLIMIIIHVVGLPMNRKCRLIKT